MERAKRFMKIVLMGFSKKKKSCMGYFGWGKWAILDLKMIHLLNSRSGVSIFFKSCTRNGA